MNKRLEESSNRQLLEYVVTEIRTVREKQETHSVAIAEVKKDVLHLRGKVAAVSSLIGAVVGYFGSLITGHK